jgi:hypothetical protein
MFKNFQIDELRDKLESYEQFAYPQAVADLNGQLSWKNDEIAALRNELE